MSTTVEQLYTGCLSQGAYYIESNGEAAVIDPLRETAPYIELAERRGATIKYVLETHFHADFVSGHVDLARTTGATIVYGPNAETDYDVHVARDGEVLELGDLRIKVMHTPGHTLESTTYLLIDEAGNDHAIFTGDTLFLGDVGRPDLAIKQGELTQEDLAGMLYDSLRGRIMPLGDDVIVYPGHGAGSACGKNLSTDTMDTLGNQKATNYALRADMTRDEFIEEVTAGLVAPPAYFPQNAMMNKRGYDSYDQVLERGMTALSVQEVADLADQDDVLILDTRHEHDVVRGFVPGSLFIGLDGRFAPWVGAMIPDVHQKLVLVTEHGREEEAVRRLARVGYDHALGYLSDGFEAWQAAGRPVDAIDEEAADDLIPRLGEAHVLDVRKASEHFSERLDVPHVENVPLDVLRDRLSEIDPSQTHHLHCAGGYRSVIAATLLKANGVEHLVNVAGGFDALRASGAPVTDYVCPSTML